MNFLNDIKVAFRVLRKAAGFSVAAVIVLALGIGANSAIFSIVYGVLLRPLPFANSDRLVQLWHVPPAKSFPGLTQFSLSAANYLDWEQQNDVFEKTAVYCYTDFRLTGNGDPQVIQAARVEPTFFSVLAMKPLLGRAIGAGDDQPGQSHVVVLSHKLWKTQFGGDEHIVGRALQLNGQSYTVIGVMSPAFVKPEFASLWTPLVWDPVERTVRGEHHFLAVGLLKPHISIAQAQSELSAIAARLARQYPADNAGWGAKVVPLREETVGDVRKPLLILLGAVACVLLIACANVANLIMARTLARRKEIAIRTALGANRARIMRQILSESVLLSLAGSALGLIVAHFSTRLVVDYLGSSLPRFHEIQLDGTVLAFTFVIAVAAGLMAGAMPAWRISTADPNDALKQGVGRTDAAAGHKNTRSILVVVEVGLSLVLLVAAGLMMRTLWNLHNVDPGFAPQHLLTMSIGVSSTDYSTPEQEASFFAGLLQRVRALPGVQAAGTTDDLPLTGGGSTQPIAIQGHPEAAMADQPEVSVRLISPGYFSAMGMQLLRGRDLTEADTATSPAVVIISESMAKRFWPNEDPIGKRLTLTFFPARVREIVGVVRDVKDDGLVAQEAATLYWPLSQFYVPERMGPYHSFPLQLAVRTTTNPASAVVDVRNAIHQLSASTPITDVKTMEEVIDESISPQRLNLYLLAAFAALAVLLAAVGIYSVLAYGVRQRVREIGIRMALGANIADVLRMVLVEGMRPTLLGVAIGAAAAVAFSRVLSSLIYGVRATDALTFTGVSVLLVGVGLFASLLPAYRASRVNPLEALRDE